MKGGDLAKESAANTLKKIVDDYIKLGEFDKYVQKHADRLAWYVRDQEAERRGTFRASGAGRCPQDQAFAAIDKLLPGTLVKDVIVRPPHNARALHNGTFMHLRYHLLFDALHEIGIVRTLYAEELRYNREHDVSGTVDRVVSFEFGGKTITAVLDYKSMKAKYYADLVGPKQDHAMQQHAYRLFGYDADRWIMLYENKDTHEIKMYDRPYDMATMEQLKANYATLAQFVESYVTETEVPKLPLITQWCNWCEWQGECARLNPERLQIKPDYSGS